MNTFGFQCDKVIIIESLPDEERQIRDGKLMSSGEYYIENLFPYCNSFREQPVQTDLRVADSALELFNHLDSICKRVHDVDEIPLIHFEIHGRDQKDGMTLKNGDFVDWHTLLEKLTDINVASANHLFVVFATCSGAFNIKYIMPRERPFPYYAAIAPDKPDFPIFLEQRYSLFYISMIIDGDMEKAFKDVISGEGYARIISSTCEFYLYQAFNDVICNLKAKQSHQNTIDKLIDLLSRRDTQSFHMSSDELRRRIQAMLSDPSLGSNTLQRMKDKYLMANDTRNVNRFGFTVEELLTAFKVSAGS